MFIETLTSVKGIDRNRFRDYLIYFKGKMIFWNWISSDLKTHLQFHQDRIYCQEGALIRMKNGILICSVVVLSLFVYKGIILSFWHIFKDCNWANNRHISPAEACNELMAYSLILS